MSSQGLCKSFLLETQEATHDWSSDTFYIALYDTSATIDTDTTAYTTDHEITGTGYTAGGVELSVASGYPVLDGSTVLVDLDDVVISGAAFTVQYALIYNASKANRAVAVLDFGQPYLATTSFTIAWPDPTVSSCIIRFGA